MVYTSYYNNRGKGSGKMIAISRTFPAWLDKSQYVHMPDVAPSIELRDAYKSGEITFREFSNRYIDELSFEAVSALMEEIKSTEDGTDVYLLCHEKDMTTCHRFVLGGIVCKLGIPCKEF